MDSRMVATRFDPFALESKEEIAVLNWMRIHSDAAPRVCLAPETEGYNAKARVVTN
jgi:hypothetical protein